MERGEDESPEDVKRRVGSISNGKLLRLRERFDRLAEFKNQKSALVDAVVASRKREKDTGYKTHLARKPAGSLLDMLERDRKALARERARAAAEARSR